MSQITFRIKLATVLWFLVVTHAENNSATRQGIFSDQTRDSSIPGDIELVSQIADVSGGRLYAYRDLPPISFEQKISKSTSRRTKRSSNKYPSHLHKCKYCMQRYLKQKRMQRLRSKPLNTMRRKHYVARHVPKVPKGSFVWPVDPSKFWISSYFGKRGCRLHKGWDLAALQGTPVVAAASGIVEMSCPAGTFGNMILIRHGSSGYKTRYAHLRRRIVSHKKPNNIVAQGQVIGYVGHTGRVTGDHLHFEVLYKNRPVNPRYFFS
ncbi:M23 family metallopeptidase [Candidatus Babeliales bacterium]|nr:M23 family metallopeptidase [Candidatus Babeliales bacterium]